MAQFVATADANFDITGYPYQLSKSNNVTLTLNQVVDLDGVNDYVNVNGLITSCALFTTGSIGTWMYIDSDDGGDHAIVTFSRNANATVTTFLWRTGLGAGSADSPQDGIRGYFAVDGVAQWNWKSANDVLDPYIGAWCYVEVIHNGTAPIFLLNGVDITAAGSFSVSTDKTKWLKALITDATSPSDVASIGMYRSNGGTTVDFDGKFDDTFVTNAVRTEANSLATFNAGRISGTSTVTGCVGFYPFRGNANDSSGTGNNGTLVNNATVINDPAATGIYSTTSPEAYLIEAGFEYAIDAGAGNYVNVSAASDTEVTPAGTTIKYKYCFTDSATRAGATWLPPAWDDIATLETDLIADSATAKKRYLHLKVQENSDGTATPTLSDMTVTYTTPSTTVASGGHKIMRGVGTGVMTGVC